MSRSCCPECNARRGLATYPNGQWCHACHTKFNSKSLVSRVRLVSNTINLNNLEEASLKNCPWLLQYHITSEYIKTFNICYDRYYNRIVFLFNNNKSAWSRSLNPKDKNKWLFLGEKSLYYIYTFWPISDILLVEDIVSAIRISKYKNVLALGGTNFHSNNIQNHLLKAQKLIIWLDGDVAGKLATEKIYRHYKSFKEIKIINTLKDPKCFTDTDIKQLLIPEEIT